MSLRLPQHRSQMAFVFTNSLSSHNKPSAAYINHTESICVLNGSFGTEGIVINTLHSTLMSHEYPGTYLDIQTVFPGMGISIIKIRWSHDRLIFTMGIPILVRWYNYNDLEMGIWNLIVCQKLVQTDIKINYQSSALLALCEGFAKIPLTKGQ